jgi:folate-dependent phosphoribosylglycinamide formyltransferase PurN
MSRSEISPRIERIVLLTLDSLCAAAAVPILVEQLQGRIAAICLSRRFGGKYGSVWAQARRNYTRSGSAFLIYSALQFIMFYPMSFLAGTINRLRGRRPSFLPLRQLARRYGIPIFSTRNPNSDGIVDRIRSLDPDLIVICYFDHVVRRRLIEIPRCGVINIHPGLLPDNRGPVPNIWAVIDGRDRVGASVHYVDGETLDTGPILKLEALERDPSDSVLLLDCRLLSLGARMAVDVIADIESGAARAVPQDPGAGQYHSFPNREELRRFSERGGRLYGIFDFIRQFFDQNPDRAAGRLNV